MTHIEQDVSRFQVRIATLSDSLLLAQIGAETFRDSYAADNSPENMAAYLEASFSPETQARELADPDSLFLIIETEHTPAGYARLKFGTSPETVVARTPMEIARFYSRKPWIGKGVGGRLMQACLQRADAASCDVVWLDVWERNPRAIAFYRKWGFVEAGHQTFILGDDLQHDLVMTRPVDLLK
jgi:diamine N-acetyltransferase